MSPPDTSTVLVTGGAGFIGSHLVDGLIERGRRVVVLDDLSSGRRENLPAAAELEEVDVRSPEAARLVESAGASTLFHLAAQMDVRRSTADPAFDAEVNILGSLNLLGAAVRGGVRQVVFASTGGAIYGEQESFPAAEDHPTRPLSPYGVSKLAAERYLYYFHCQHGLDAVCLRFANVYGERQNPHGEAGVVAIFCELLLRGEVPTINGDGLQTRDYIHVSDVVAANIACLGQTGFHIANVGTGSEITVVEIFERLRQLVGSDLAARHGPAKPGEQRRSVIDSSHLREWLGLRPPLPFPDGLSRTLDWFREARQRGRLG